LSRITVSGHQAKREVAMIQTVRAIFADGVLKPLGPVQLPELAEVWLSIDEETIVTVDEVHDDPFEGVAVDMGITDLAENVDDYRLGRRSP